MRDEVKRDLTASAAAFVDKVWPAIRYRLQAGRLVPVEAAAAEDLAKDFDILAGIDAWQMVDEIGAMRGIASRVQWGENWRTFTVRRERPRRTRTEFEKRCYALDHPGEGWLLPALTVHAYLTPPKPGGQLIEAAIVRTTDLYAYARAHPCTKPRRNPEDGVLFDWWRWSDLLAAGIQVGTIPGDQSVPDFAQWPTFGPQQQLFSPNGEG